MNWFEERIREKRKAQEKQAEILGFPGEHRIKADGKVISHNTWNASMEKEFFNHLRNASTDPDGFVFDGYHGREGADGWLTFHRDRLHIRNGSQVELLDPAGTVLERFCLVHWAA